MPPGRTALLGLLLWIAVVPAIAATDAVILMYHRFGEDRYPSTSVTLAQFDAHLDYLDKAGYRVMPLGDVVAAIEGKGTLPDRAIAITVDDAYRSVFTDAFPRMKRRGWPFTVFVSTAGVDEGLEAFMTWEQMRTMRDAGVSFAHHTASHDSMIERREGEDASAWRKRIDADLDRGVERLNDELGLTSTLFAYPYGEYDIAASKLIEARGWTAFGQHSGAVGQGSDRRALPRFPMAEPFAALDDFKTKVASLPLSVERQEPWDPVTTDRRPSLEVVLAHTPQRIDELACYVSGQDRVDVRWVEPKKRFIVRASRDLPKGRARYNCTVPASDAGRFHWFSHQWVVK
ncbi:polysaccharide deacetylase family protein [bacterium]|nr:polysaccharide deacetylase family protein [bacterium]